MEFKPKVRWFFVTKLLGDWIFICQFLSRAGPKKTVGLALGAQKSPTQSHDFEVHGFCTCNGKRGTGRTRQCLEKGKIASH